MGANRFALIFGVLASASALVAQTQSPLLTDPNAITFAQIQEAESQNWYSIAQFRFCRTTDNAGLDQWVGLAEELDVAPPASGETHERFDLRLAAGVGLDPDEELRQQSVHSQHRAYLYQHGTFRVQDAALAAANYSIHYESTVQRLGRPAFRVTVIPSSSAANCWILDLDVETGYPMSRTEYSSDGDVLSMITVTDFQHGATAQAALDGTTAWWAPTHRTVHTSPTAAVNATQSPSKFRIPSVVPQGYSLHQSEIAIDPLNGDETLMMNFTDGVESILFLENPNAARLNLPMMSQRGSYAILEFQDLTSKQLVFQYAGVQFMTLGGADNVTLDGFTDDLLRQVVSGKR